MATDIPTGGQMGIELIIELATQGLSAIFTALHKKGAAEAVQATDQLAIALLQKTAEIKGLTIDWNNPEHVLAYMQSLPTFVPIPEPAAAPPAPAAPPAKT